MRARRTFAAIAAAVAGLAAAGCGGMSSAGSSTLGGAASVAPSNAVAFVAVDSDLSSGQWSAVDGLLRTFPAHDELLTQLRATFENRSGLSWKNDVAPALGPELDLVALPGKEPRFVGLTQSGDRAKLDALLQKLGKDVVSTQVGDWTAFSDTQAALDEVTAARTKLADNNTYRSAIEKLAGDALVRAYANGTEAQQLLSALGPQAHQAPDVPFAWASADVVASSGGLRVNGYSHGQAQSAKPHFHRLIASPYVSGLVDEIPSGALLVADFPVTPGMFQFAGGASMPKVPQDSLSPQLLADLEEVLGGETALYVRPGLPIPEVTIVTQPNDVPRAEHALDDILATVRKQGGAGGGLDVAHLPIFHASAGGQLIVSTSEQGIADFRSNKPKLSTDPAFTSAQHASGMPAKTTGFLFVNLATSLPLVRALGPMLGLKLPAGQPDLGSLKSLSAFGTRSGEDSTFSLFLEVR